jgi:hypothetical protein
LSPALASIASSKHQSTSSKLLFARVRKKKYVVGMRSTQNERTRTALAQESPKRSHEWIDRRSLALEQEVAKIIRAKPELLKKAKDNLDRWIAQRQPNVPKVMLEWREILTSWPVEEILRLLTSFDEEARRLRQSSPFCGILPPERRMEIIREYEALRT